MFSVLLPPTILYRLAHESHTKLTAFLLCRYAKPMIRIENKSLLIDNQEYDLSKLTHYLQKWVCESVFALEQTLQDSLCATSSNFKNTMNFLHNYSYTFATELRGRVSSPHDEQSRVSQEGRVSSPHDEQSRVSPRF